MRRTDDDVVLRNSNDILPPNPSTRLSHASSLELLQSIGAPTISFVGSKTAIGEGRKEESSLQCDNVVVANEDKSESSFDRLGFLQGHELFPMYKVDDLMEWKSVKSIGPGLYNHGNTCYINSTLQCLLYIPALAQYLVQESDEYIAVGGIELKEGRERVSFDALALISRLARNVHGLQKNGKNIKAAINPTEIVKNIRYLGKQFTPGRHEDAHEFLRQLVDKMAAAYLFRRSVKSNAPYRLGETTPIHRIFAGYLCNRVTCLSCGFKTDNFDMIMDLCLDMGKKVYSVEHALQRFLAAEMLSTNNRWKCSNCHKFVCAKKQFTIHVAPRVLVIQLKRFKYGQVGKKLRHRLHYPLVLSVPTSGGEGHVKYALCGVMVHAGQSIQMGHYFAYVRGANRLWYLMDDDVVQQARTYNVLSQEAYMLFYYQTDHALNGAPPSHQPRAAVGAMQQQQQVDAERAVQYTLSQPLSSSREENGKMEQVQEHGLLGRLRSKVQRTAAKKADLINKQCSHRIFARRHSVKVERLAWAKTPILKKFMHPGRERWKRLLCFAGGYTVIPARKREVIMDINSSSKLKVQKRDLNGDVHFDRIGGEKGLHASNLENGNIQGANVNQLVDGDNACIKRNIDDEEEVVPCTAALPSFRKPIDSSTLSGNMQRNMNGRFGGKIDPNQEDSGVVMTTLGVGKLQSTTTSVSYLGGGGMGDLGGWEGLDGEEGAKLQHDRTLQAEINTFIQNAECRFNLRHERDAWDMALDKGKARKAKATREPIGEGTNKLFQRAQYEKQKISDRNPNGSHNTKSSKRIKH